MAGFIEVPLTQDAGQIATEALERLTANMEAKGYVGWKAQAAGLLAILVEELSPIAEDNAQVASVVPPAIFRRFGTKLVQFPYNEGAAATGTTVFTLSPDSEGKYPARKIPAGLQVAQGNYGFYVESEVNVAEGSSTATVQVVAVSQGTEYNEITGVLEPVESIDWLKEVALVGETTGGADQEEDSEYQDRLSERLTLFGEVIVTAANMVSAAKDSPSTILPAGEVGRSTAIDGYNPSATSFTGTTVNKSTTLSEVSSFTGITEGSELEGAGIPAHTTVVSINTGAKTLVMSVEATASNSKESIKAIGSYENGKTITVFVTDKQGKKLTSEAMAALKAWLLERARINDKVYVEPPSYSKMYVTAKVHVEQGYEEASVIASVKAALEAYLSPATWANPTHATTGATAWLNRVEGWNIVRYNALIGVIESVPGVSYVFAGSEGLKIGLTASPSGTADVTLPGPAPLAETEASALVITAG